MQNIPLHKLLFFDVETVSQQKDFLKLRTDLQELWQHKHQFLRKDDDETFEVSYQNNAAIYAEFGKIVCISCGYFNGKEFRIKSFYSNNEKQLLQEFANMLNSTRFILCGHNIKEFDVPYVCRRMLVNAIKLPNVLNVAGKKPWEVDFIDTLQLWKFGDYKSYTSLNLLAAIFDIPTPKDDIDGSMVGKVYWQDEDLPRIVAYCQKDVVTVVRLLQKWQQEPLLEDDNVIVV